MANSYWSGQDPTTVNLASNTAQGDGQINATLRSVFDYYHATYGWWKLRWVQAKDAVTYAAGQSLQWFDSAHTQVTNDRSGGAGLAAGAAGIALSVYTTACFVPILISGYYPTVVTNGDDDIAASIALIVATGTDGACDSGTSTPDLYLGTSTAADVDAANTVAAFINVIDQSGP